MIVGETWSSESEGILSESKSDSDYELAPSMAKKRCSTPSGQLTT